MICQGYELKTRLSGTQGLSHSDLTSQEKEKLFFLFFFLLHSGRPTLVQTRTHTHTHTPSSISYSTWYKKLLTSASCHTNLNPRKFFGKIRIVFGEINRRFLRIFDSIRKGKMKPILLAYKLPKETLRL